MIHHCRILPDSRDVEIICYPGECPDEISPYARIDTLRCAYLPAYRRRTRVVMSFFTIYFDRFLAMPML